MNREDIIRMAREAGLVKQTQSGREIWMADPEVLLQFGQLIEAEEGLAQYKHGYAAGAAAERKAMMQLFTDPENQPTQHGTVTVEYMQREIAAERNSWPAEMEAMERQVNILTDALAQAKELGLTSDKYRCVRNK